MSRDGSWDVDLIWKYFHETPGPASGAATWYQFMDPDGDLNDRKKVYAMLVSEHTHTNPDTSNLRQSKIPWNQRNAGIMKAFRTKMKLSEAKSELACGSVVKLTFMKYMGWGGTLRR